MRLHAFTLLAALLMFPAAKVAAEEQGASRSASEKPGAAWTIYGGRGIDSDLLQIPRQLVEGPDYESAYFVGGSYRQPLSTPAPLQRAFDWLRVPNTQTGFELIAVKYSGLQSNVEVDAAYTLTFAPLRLGPVGISFGAGWGLSYAFGTPAYEDGPKHNPERRYRFQSYSSYELAWQHTALPRWALITRIHHRSGAYGLIAPRRVGSNFLTIGVRYWP